MVSLPRLPASANDSSFQCKKLGAQSALRASHGLLCMRKQCLSGSCFEGLNGPSSSHVQHLAPAVFVLRRYEPAILLTKVNRYEGCLAAELPDGFSGGCLG